MTIKAIRSLICPYCGHPFHLQTVIERKGDEIRYGSLVCRCDEFPIIEGIIYLRKEKAKKILYYIQRNDPMRACIAAIDEVSWMESRVPPYINRMILRHVLDPRWLRRNASSRLRYLWRILFRRTSEEYRFFFTRHTDTDWLLLFLMTNGISNTSASVRWVNVGAGIQNPYTEILRKFPSVHFFSIEKSFLNLYLTVALYPTRQTTYICSDGSTGTLFTKRSIDIVTFLDSLLFMPHQQQTIRSITDSGILRTDGTVFVSAMAEHMYFPVPKTYEVYPINGKLLETYFPSRVIFFDHEKLSICLRSATQPITDAIVDEPSQTNRYCVLWPKSYTPKLRIRPYLPYAFRQYPVRMWQQPDILWRNKVF